MLRVLASHVCTVADVSAADVWSGIPAAEKVRTLGPRAPEVDRVVPRVVGAAR